MSITKQEQLEKLRACGRIVAKALRMMAAAVRPGVTTAELAFVASKVLAEHGARSSPPLVYGFPGEVCISVNDEVVHGIPGDRVLQPGDLVKLDLTAEKDGYHTDSAVTVQVAPTASLASHLTRCAERAFRQSLSAARPGNAVREIGRAVEREVRRRGFHIIRELGGHGIGHTIHEEPSVPNFPDALNRALLTEPGPHHRAHHRRRHQPRHSRPRQVDHPHRRSFSGRTLRTHPGHHQGCPPSPHRLEVS